MPCTYSIYPIPHPVKWLYTPKKALTKPYSILRLDMDDLNPESSIEVDHIECTPAPLMYLVGHPYPLKGLPTVEAIERVNTLKRLLKRGRWVQARLALRNTPQDFLCPVAREVAKVSTLLAEILEHDQAYRFRFQDLVSETSKDGIGNRPYRETRRLVRLYFQRESSAMSKMWWMHLLPFAMLYFVKYLESLDWQKMQFDEGDRYWACKKLDYNYMGLNYWARQKLLKVS